MSQERQGMLITVHARRELMGSSAKATKSLGSTALTCPCMHANPEVEAARPVKRCLAGAYPVARIPPEMNPV